MTEQITKKNLKELSVSITKAIDKRLVHFEHSMIQTVGKQLHDFEQRNNAHFYVIETRLGNLEQRMEEFDRKLDRLMNTLDAFLKRLTDFDDEFTILKAEVDLIKDILKEKLGVEVALQK